MDDRTNEKLHMNWAKVQGGGPLLRLGEGLLQTLEGYMAV